MSNLDHDHDPQTMAVLNDITRTKNERDALKLDIAEKDRQLAAADARNKHLERTLAVVQAQRDTYMGKIIEITTHMAEIEHHYERLSLATKAVIKMRDTQMPEPPKEDGSDPEASLAAAERSHRQVVERYAPPRVREAAQQR